MNVVDSFWTTVNLLPLTKTALLLMKRSVVFTSNLKHFWIIFKVCTVLEKIIVHLYDAECIHSFNWKYCKARFFLANKIVLYYSIGIVHCTLQLAYSMKPALVKWNRIFKICTQPKRPICRERSLKTCMTLPSCFQDYL